MWPEVANSAPRQWVAAVSEASRIRFVRRFLCALPRDAKVYGIKFDERRRPVEESLPKAAPELVLVEVELD